MFSESKKTLRLVQYNVENLFLVMDLYKGQDLKTLTESEWRKIGKTHIPNKSLRKTWTLAEIVKDLDPDILMLNEVGGVEAIENLNKYFLNSKYQVHLKEGNSRRGIDVGYLVRADLEFKAVHITHKDRPIDFLYPHESQTPAGGKSHYFSRDVSELRLFKPGDTSPRLTLLLTHLKSKLDNDKIDFEGKLRRAAELKCLVNIYKEVKAELGADAPIIAAGDFNGIASPHGTEPEFKSIYEESDLVDAFELTSKPKDERYTQVQITHSGKQELLQIDYMFLSPALHNKIISDETYAYRYKDPSGKNAPIPKNMEERSLYTSDHYPVVLTLKL
jgi:endonuclease/exonuclease/phosphatase family metal-dependent hydrolase